MIKSTAFVWLLLLFFSNPGQTANAGTLSKTYTWSPPTGNRETFNIYLETAKSWQLTHPLDVLVRFTLTAKPSSMDHVDVRWTRIELTDRQTFLQDSGKIEETVSLRSVGEHYERRTSFHDPSSIKLAKGETLSASVIWNIQIDIVSDSATQQTYTGSNSRDPLIITVSRPLLSTNELVFLGITGIGFAILIVGAVLLYTKMKVGRSEGKDQQRQS